MVTSGKPSLTIEALKASAKIFAELADADRGKKLLTKRDGKSIGSHIQESFLDFLAQSYTFERGNSAKGLDLPDPICVDIKTTSSRKPQSSSPVTTIEEKIFGLGHSLLIFIYKSESVKGEGTVSLIFRDVLFIDKSLTGDKKITKSLLDILEKPLKNEDDIFAYLEAKNVYIDPEKNRELAHRIYENPPRQGYLTLSNAMQWRLSFAPALKSMRTSKEIEGLSSLIEDCAEL